MVMKELICNSFLLWEGMAVLKELIFNRFYFRGRCAGLEKKLHL